MSYYLKVTTRGSIMGADRKRYRPGTRLSKGECEGLFGGTKEVDRLVDQGYLVRLTEQVDPDEHPLPPQTTAAPAHPSTVEKDEPGMETVGKGEAEGNAPVVGGSDNAGTVLSRPGEPWDVDPATIADKDVHELNVMIAERSSDVPPFETAEEARAWLSQNFKAEGANVATG